MVRGVACIPPSQPKAIVSVRYAQRTAEAKWSDAVKNAADPVLASLRFIPLNLDAIKQARDAVRAEKVDQAVTLLRQPAEDGDSEAAVFLGNMYLYGRVTKPDYDKARYWLEKASRDGLVDALYNLGAMYDKGIGVERDVKQALRWFTLAADQRDPQAQLNLGIIYANGNGVDRDVALGEQWLKRAAANGNKRAEGLLRTGTIGKPQQ
jgi:TPR repeat protein